MSSWTDEKVEELVRRVRGGESAEAIAVALGVTRNAVLGKAHRMGLSLAGGPGGRPRADSSTGSKKSMPSRRGITLPKIRS